jgi:hypothetical protein
MGRMGQGASVAPKIPETAGHLTLERVPDSLQGKRSMVVLDAGALGPGAYACRINTTGMNSIFVNLRPSAVSGTFAPTIQTTWEAGGARTTSAGANFVANTNQELTIASLAGQRTVEVIFTVPGGGSITFDRAEFNGL